jgi:hypothetical protein
VHEKNCTGEKEEEYFTKFKVFTAEIVAIVF